MSSVIRKTIVASLAALTLGLGVAATTSPAEAGQWHQHGYGGGYGGHGYYHRGWGGGWGPAVGLGILGGLAAGAIVGSDYYGGPYYGGAYYGDSCVRYTAVYDQWGRYMGRSPVNVCN
jgi:hypothetical protein